MVYIGADHGGFPLKRDIVAFLQSIHHPYRDLGPDHYTEGDDYPPIAEAVAEAVIADPDSRGVLICGSGTGMVIVANKVPGIRAAFGYSVYAARMARHDNNANIITFAGRKQTAEEVRPILMMFLETSFSGEERHVRRVQEITRLETALHA